MIFLEIYDRNENHDGIPVEVRPTKNNYEGKIIKVNVESISKG
jgi:hypothetical protein